MARDLLPKTGLEQIAGLGESSATRALRELQPTEIERISRSLLTANDALVAAAQSPGFMRIAEQIRSLERVAIDPAFVQRISQVQDGLVGLSLKIQPAIVPALETLTRLSAEVARVIEPYQGLLAGSNWEASLTRRMKLLDRPWAIEEHVGVSAAGFARIARISDAAHADLPYAEAISELLWEELGSGAGEDADTAIERDAAAIQAGLQPELIAFPPQGYGRVILAAGFHFQFEVAPVPDAIEEHDPHAVFDPMHGFALTQVEQRLRQLIEARLRAIAGNAWIKQRVPHGVRKGWEDRQTEDRDTGRTVYQAIQYADFMDMADIIGQSNNWNEAFAEIFRNKEDFQVSLRRLHPIRKALAHSRPLGRADILTLVAETTRILRALGVKLSED